MPIRLALADDHPIVLQGLRQLFAREPDVEVVSCSTNGADAVDAVRRQPVDVLMMDMRMPGVSGLDVLRRLREEQLRCKAVLLTASIDDAQVVEAVQLGARGIVLKEAPPETLIECVRRVHAGHQWIDQATLTRAFDHVVLRDAAARAAALVLTPREIDVVRMVTEGLRNRDIARRMGISEGTVKIHLHHVYEKLGVDGRGALVVYVRQNGLI
jgi:two-component system, NarL family, nitrate/nitrite response regulator NarL